MKVIDYDIIDHHMMNPNAEKNYADLRQRRFGKTWHRRIRCPIIKSRAELSETDRFITVDGDNIRADFLQQELNIRDDKIAPV